jgi:hypothetical protein
VSVSSVETKSGTIAATSNVNVTISTTLTTNDMVVVLVNKTGTTGTPGASGLGTWTTEVAGTANLDHYMFSMTGVTGGGVINVSVGGTGQSGDYVVYVLRSSIGAAVTKHGSSQEVTSAGSPSVASCLRNMFTCLTAIATTGTITSYPGAAAVPSTGWATDYIGGNTGAHYVSQTLAANANVAGAAGTVNTGSPLWVTTLGVFKDGDTSTPSGPLTNTFIGWGHPIF